MRPVGADFATPVRSDVPTLLLTRATYAKIPAGGHVVTRTSPCARTLLTRFIATGGTAERRCLRR